jgi:tetratricopeptide (TPR) repeat protein
MRAIRAQVLALMPGYSAREAARLLDLSVAQVRSYVRAGFLQPARGPRGELVFSFQDLVLLRTAKSLVAARIPPRRVRTTLKQLADQLPGRPLSGLSIAADGRRIVVRDGDELWNAENGQVLFDFTVDELAAKVAPILRRQAADAHRDADSLSAEDWYALGCELETSVPEQARDAYRRALELMPSHIDARLNLGRLLHEAGQLEAAEAHYRAAIDQRSDDGTAWFNLGVALEDQGRHADAVEAYRLAIELEPANPDSYYNLGHLYERLERPSLAQRYLNLYRRLIVGEHS